MKESEGLEAKKAVMDEEKQDKDKVAHEGNSPGASGGGSGAKDGSMVWDVTKAQACVEQLLKLFPDMALDKARSLLELVCDDHIDDSETFQTSAANATLAEVFGDPKHAEAKNAGGGSLDNFLPLLTDLRAEAKQGMEKRATRRTSERRRGGGEKSKRN
jgi:hypothetical protein